MEILGNDADEARVCAIIKGKMTHPLDMKFVENMYTLDAVVSYIFSKYVNDASVIRGQLMTVERLSLPTSDVQTLKNLEIIIPNIQGIEEAGMLDKVTLEQMQMMEKRVFRADKLDDYLKEKITIMAKYQ